MNDNSNMRRIKFKTLDNKITEMIVNKDIYIPDLKQKIKEELGFEVELQRLIYKGKQFKDDKNLSDYINQDDEIVHLMSRMKEQATSNTNQGQENMNINQGARVENSNTSSGNNGSGTNINQNTFNFSTSSSTSGNPFGNILGNILNNPNTMVQMTSMILGDNQGGGLDLNNLLGNLGNLGNSNSSSGGSVNLGSLMSNILNPNANTGTTQNSGSRNSNSQSQQSNPQSQQPQQSQTSTSYPILNPINQHLGNLEQLINNFNGQIETDRSSEIPSIPNLN